MVFFSETHFYYGELLSFMEIRANSKTVLIEWELETVSWLYSKGYTTVVDTRGHGL